MLEFIEISSKTKVISSIVKLLGYLAISERIEFGNGIIDW
jgi:hypothetical protein